MLLNVLVVNAERIDGAAEPLQINDASQQQLRQVATCCSAVLPKGKGPQTVR